MFHKWLEQGLAVPALIWLVLFSAGSRTTAAPLHAEIDRLVAAGWAERGLQAAALSSDAEFLRRLYLDLVGTIPTAAEARAFLDDPAPDKRARLIEILLASPAYARHMQHVFDSVFLERQDGNYVSQAEWQEYLRASFAANKPWDQLVRELVASDGSDLQTRPALRFYTVRTVDSNRVLNPTHLTRDIGRLFLGVNLQCAQCHDHPSIEDYKQADYHGIKAFVDRLHFFQGKVADKPLMLIAEKAEGDGKFYSVFDPAKLERQAVPHLPGLPEVPDPVLVKGKEYVVAPGKDALPVPAYSRRAQLARQLTAAENLAFRRNAVNRFWEWMMGRGLVHPADLTHAGNRPSHPELLELLGRHFAEKKFDTKDLLRELALSRTYQLASVPPPGSGPLPPEAFAVAPLKPLRPHQLAFAMMQASGYTDVQRVVVKGDEKVLYDRLASQLKPFTDAYARPAGQAEGGFEASLFQALFLGNGAPLNAWVRPQPGNLADRLTKLDDPARAAEELCLSVFSRRPSAAEAAAVAGYLQEGGRDRALAAREMVWALIAAAEFRFNH
jgi:hypothetical protein